jgi:hypothetical protein
MKLETAQTGARGDDYAGQELMQEEFSLQHGHGLPAGELAGLRWLCMASHAGMAVSTGNAAERKAGVFEAGDIREWRGHDVVDPDGHKIGELEAVYVDTSTDLPAFGTVKVGMPTRYRLVFVPLAQATVGPGYLKVAHDKKHVKDSPSISTDGELPAAGEEAIFKHYGLTYQAGTSGERQLARR